MRIRIFLISQFLLFSILTFSQNNTEDFSILFYNVENLFDTIDNSLTEDDEFTPGGERYWTRNKLNSKLLNISKVILSSNGWKHPGIIGLCEVENRYVLEMLLQNTPLRSIEYKIIHKESPDERGIDVALLYDANMFNPIIYDYYPLQTKNGEIDKTREILYVSGTVNGNDTLHLFVNHWPSRYSGLLETRKDRNAAALLLRQKYDELLEKESSPKIVIVGDFNDQPHDESLAQFLGAKKIEQSQDNNELYNLSYNWVNQNSGTLKYQSQWSVFDQIIVTGSLLDSKKGMKTDPQNAVIVKPSFILEKDEKFGGVKPKRTFYGYSYKGGFSDHLPVLIKLNSTD